MSLDDRPEQQLTRRRVLAAAVAGAGGLLVAGLPVVSATGTTPERATASAGVPVTASAGVPATASAGGPATAAAPTAAAPDSPPAGHLVAFHSRPDLRPPVVAVRASDADDAALFVTPAYGTFSVGAVITDARGELIWQRHAPGRLMAGLRPISFAGGPAISWWEGTITPGGLGDGEFVIVDDRYQELARFRTVVHPSDIHELRITPDGSAYVFATQILSRDGRLLEDALVQEVEISTGRLLWEWRASDHIAPVESDVPPPKTGAWDYLHLNSIDIGPSGDLLVSARHTSTLYLVSRATGRILWRLGGARSDFRIDPSAVFRAQHDARLHPDGIVSLFDNATRDPADRSAPSRGMVLRIDLPARTATLVRDFPAPLDRRPRIGDLLRGGLWPARPIVSSSQGSLTLTDDGRATIGWGSSDLVTGYDPQGRVVFEAALPPGFSSYRAYRARWVGRPADQPIARVGRVANGAITAWVSWNGATEVTGWQLAAGVDPTSLVPAATVPRVGFETALGVPAGARYVRVSALDGRGQPLDGTRVLEVAAELAT